MAMIGAEDIAALTDAEARKVLGMLMVRFQKSQRQGVRLKLVAAMAVGDTVLLRGINGHSNFTDTKRRARAHMDNPEADWSTRRTNQGLRIVRTR
jgi:hypothetical protein